MTHAHPRILFLVRHGRSDASSTDFVPYRNGPQWDPPLDATGAEQARLLARRLLVMDPPSAVWCSPMRRARETIAPYAYHYIDNVKECKPLPMSDKPC